MTSLGVDEDRIQALIEDNRFEDVARELDAVEPADAAEVLEALDDDELAFVFSRISMPQAAVVLAELGRSQSQLLFEELPAVAVGKLLNEMPPDDAVDLLSELQPEQSAVIMEKMGDTEAIRRLMQHPEDTAGQNMTTEMFAVPATANVKETRSSLVPMELTDPLLYVYVTEPETGKLKGIVTLKELFLAKPEARLGDIVNQEFVACSVNEDQEEVARKFKKYDLWVIPVIDECERLVGRITVDDIMDIVHEEADEDLAYMAGTPDIDREITSPVGIARLRFPWLLITLFGGMANSLLIRQLIDTGGVVALAIFVPAIMAMGGNTGIQSSAIAIRGIAMGYGAYNRLAVVVRREILVGILLGLTLGIIAGGVVWTLVQLVPIDTEGIEVVKLAMTVGFAMSNSMIFGSFYGALVPVVLDKLKVDPALASGPFVTCSNDLASAFIYFLTCMWMLNS